MKVRRLMVWALVVLGSANGVFIAFQFARYQLNTGDRLLSLLPLPGLYLLEIGLASILTLLAVWKIQRAESRQWQTVLWSMNGILLAFVILGAWTIGIPLAPSFLAFLIVDILLAGGDRRRLVRGFATLSAAGLIQAVIILILVWVW
ncbi:MAG: hypothetical protein JXB38_09490 [Anaerolineales bacterium]|nr:hypothetical protein [Anaerolineales bacterium]